MGNYDNFVLQMTKPTPILIFLCFLLGSLFSKGAIAEHDLEIDLRDAWLIYDGDYRAVPTDTEFDEKVIYLEIDLEKHTNSFLRVTSPTVFSIFINGTLSINKAKKVALSLDSIREKMGSSSVLLAIYQQGGVSAKRLQTTLVAQRDAGTNEPVIIARAATYIRDFVVLGVLVILVFLILIIAQNPKLAADYFSIRKLFAAPGRQDKVSDNRTTSSSNILFQAFCSLLGGFLMTILFTYLKDQYTIATLFVHTTMWGSILIWLILSAVILGIFFLKQVIIYLFAYLFGIEELSVTHYFNLMRLFFWTLGLSAAGVSMYLIAHGQQVGVFENIYFLIGWVLGFWVVLIFFKLSRRVGFSMFHLFSYLCATEIIPLIITIKVLYY